MPIGRLALSRAPGAPNASSVLQHTTEAEEAFNRPGALPEQPDSNAVVAWLRGVRAVHFVDDGMVAQYFRV